MMCLSAAVAFRAAERIALPRTVLEELFAEIAAVNKRDALIDWIEQNLGKPNATCRASLRIYASTRVPRRW